MHPSFPSLGSFYKDFQVVKNLELDELQSTLIQLVHIPTGACVLHIANSDPENVFCLSFQTLPDSSNGVAHILEHTVLCGSKKFPVKDPFFAMTRRSLNTYMNAMTGQDFTCYPASSQVEKDFYNLLEIYLDAVFHPELKKKAFLQEGHRLEWVDHKLQFQGVVYNEMKGAMSSAESRLWDALAERLTPDLPYAYNSGGRPSEIPSLSYEELLAFHSTFYHPSRCLFFFYGNLPLENHLDFISTKALQGVAKVAPIPPLPLQPRFKAPIKASAPYPVAKGETERKAEISFSWLTAPLADQEKALSLSLLDLMLFDNDASPLKMALLKSGLCSQVESSMDLEMSEIPWIVICKGCDAKDAPKLKKILLNALEEIVKTPFPPEMIEASLHQLEFERTEISSDGFPFGLALFFRAALIHQHGNEPENALLIHTLFAQLRERASDPEYLTNLLRQQTLDNTHFVELILEPDPDLDQKESEEEQKRLKAIQDTLSESDIQAIEAQSKELLAYQEEVENQSLDCLPKLSLTDVPPHVRDFSLEHKKKGRLDVFHHDCFTNQIIYADLLFDLPDIPEKDLPLLSLFSRLISEVGCGGRNYEETLAYQQAYIGGIGAQLSLHVAQENPNVCRPSFSIRGKALARNGDKLFSLFKDMVSSPDFQNLPRIQEILSQHATQLKTALVRNAMNYAVQLSLSGHSLPSHINNQWSGMPYYQAAIQWASHCNESLLADLERIQKWVLTAAEPHLILSCSQETYDALQKQSFFHIADAIPNASRAAWKGDYSLPKSDSHVRFVASPVAFSAYGMHTASYRDSDAPLLHLATELLDNCFLHKEIREKGGAYGSGASYSPTSGNFHLYAFRDPHLVKSKAAFHRAIEGISRGKFNERELEEAKFGVLQAIDAPIPPGNRAMVAYAWLRAGRTRAIREAFRQKILNATKKEVADAVERRLLKQPGVFVSFLGQELFEKEKKKLETPLPVRDILS